MSLAMGMMARAAEKKSTGAGTSARSSATDSGMNAKSQLTEGLRENVIASRSGADARHAARAS